MKDPRKRNHSKKISYTGELLEIRIDSVFFQDVATYDASVEPLKITIEIMTYSDHKSVVYLFFLLPSSYVPASNTSHNYSHYPLVLVKASSKVKSLMIEWFRQEYLASFAPLYIPPLYMKYMINIWVESIHNLPDQDSFEYGKYTDVLMETCSGTDIILVPNEMIRTPLKLEYKRDDKNLSSIEIELKQDQVIEICSKLIDKNMFLDVFHEHVLNTTKVNLNSLTFYQVQNSLAVFRRDGSVKVRIKMIHWKLDIHIFQRLVDMLIRPMQ